MQPDKIADVRVQADVREIDLLDQPDGGIRGAQVRVLDHLEGDQEADLGGVPTEFLQPGDGVGPRLLVAYRVHMALRHPEPELRLLGLGEHLVESKRDDLTAEPCCGIESAVAVRQVLPPVHSIDHALTNHRDRRHADADADGNRLQLVEPRWTQVTRPQAAIGDVDVAEACVRHFPEDGPPVAGLVVRVDSTRDVRSRERQEAGRDRPRAGSVRHRVVHPIGNCCGTWL